MNYAVAQTLLPSHLPDFVTRRMDLHYITRIEQLLGGEHPHAGKPRRPTRFSWLGTTTCAWPASRHWSARRCRQHRHAANC
jgi:hypothetical protein